MKRNLSMMAGFMAGHLLLGMSNTQASVTVSGSPGTTTTIGWDRDLVFTITDNQDILAVVFDEWVGADDGMDSGVGDLTGLSIT